MKPPGRPVVLAYLLLMTLTSLPYLKARLAPPAGARFVGTFHWIDDLYLYAAFAQQAESGAFLLENKLYPREHRALYFNLELWAVGRVSRWLGRRPFLAFRLLAACGALALLPALARLLRKAGLPESRSLFGLLLVTLGGGTGGLLFLLTPRTAVETVDLSFGVFPFLGLLANPHWVAAQALMLWLLLVTLAPASSARLAGIFVLGSVLGLVRPYDLFVLMFAHTAATLALDPPAAWPRRLAPLLLVCPVAGYNVALVTLAPAYAGYLRNPYVAPPLSSFVQALGPAALVVLLTRPWRGVDAGERRVQVTLLAWSSLAVLVPALGARGPSLQLLVAVGTPLLVLAAIGLSRLRAAVLWLALPFFCSTAAVAWLIVLRDEAAWQVPAERYEAALALRPLCRPRDVVLAPPDIGLYVGGLTDCRALVSHLTAPDYDERLGEVVSFYGSTPRAARGALLERLGVAFVVLPGDQGEVPVAWLGAETPFRRAAVVGQGARAISLYCVPGRRAIAPAG